MIPRRKYIQQFSRSLRGPNLHKFAGYRLVQSNGKVLIRRWPCAIVSRAGMQMVRQVSNLGPRRQLYRVRVRRGLLQFLRRQFRRVAPLNMRKPGAMLFY